MYVVHIFETQSKHSFEAHSKAYKAFKLAAKKKLTVALWNRGPRGKWTIVHHTGFYPTAMTEPPSTLYDSNKGAA